MTMPVRLRNIAKLAARFASIAALVQRAAAAWAALTLRHCGGLAVNFEESRKERDFTQKIG